ncbi:MAG: nitroreductase family protein [Clostridia bacterium]|nr:nitroreductase family protein [Clostridia bacterium]
MNEIIQSLLERKSVRAYTDQEISEENVQLILNAAMQAPTAGNQQLYTILRITDPEKKHRLSISCDNQPFIEQAGLVLVFCADCLKWLQAYQAAGAHPRKPGAGDLFIAFSDANIAAQNAVTAAQSLGIGSCYIGDIMEQIETQREILDLPKYVFPAAMVVFGYPTAQQMERAKPERVPARFIVQENAYHIHSESELREMFAGKTQVKTYDEWMKAFCERKYNSDFSREMTRSVNRALADFEYGKEAMDAFAAIHTRRSTRRMKPDLPDRKLIEQVIEAGRRAPSGGNSQTTHMLVITKPEILRKLREAVASEFARMEYGPSTYASVKHSIEASRKGGYIYDYGAPVLIVTANRKGYGNALADSACALENMMIAANALNLGACWINQLHWLDEHEAVRNVLEELGLRPDETITGGLILGFSLSGEPNREELPRTGNPVTWIE